MTLSSAELGTTNANGFWHKHLGLYGIALHGFGVIWEKCGMMMKALSALSLMSSRSAHSTGLCLDLLAFVYIDIDIDTLPGLGQRL